MVSKHLVLLLLVTEVWILTIPGAGDDLTQAEDAANNKQSYVHCTVQWQWRQREEDMTRPPEPFCFTSLQQNQSKVFIHLKKFRFA